MNSWKLTNGRIIDPAAKRDAIGGLHSADGRIAASADGDGRTFDVTGLIITPGLVDIHVHLREPGFEHKETIATGTAAAAAGGFTTIACMPNTKPALDTPEMIKLVLDRAKAAGHAHVHPIAAATVARAGRDVVNFQQLIDAGAIGFSDDGDGVEDDRIMAEAMRRAKACNSVMIQHCEFHAMSNGGVMHTGPTCKKLGLPGWDPRAEEAMIERDIALLREIGGRYHVAHISTAKSADLVRRAKAEGLGITAEICPHHLLLCDEDCAGGDPNFKMNPPLRTREDVAACRAALADGTIDCIVTDHAPHTLEEKSAGFLKAPFGIVGLETSLATSIEAMVATGLIDWPGLIDRMTRRPAQVLDLSCGHLSVGAPADVCVIDPERAWTIDPDMFASKGRNTPFARRLMRGAVVATFLGGRMTYVHEAYRERFR